MKKDQALSESASGTRDRHSTDGQTFAPLPGEMGIPDVAAPQRQSVSKKGLIAVALLVSSLAVVSVFTLQRLSAGAKKFGADDSKLVRDRPAAASTEPRKLDLTGLATAPNSAPASAPQTPRVPALVPTEEELAEPIGVRRTGAATSNGSGAKVPLPEDAPVLLVSSRPNPSPAPTAGIVARPLDSYTPPDGGEPPAEPVDPLTATSRNLQAYQRQLQGLLENLTKTADQTSNGYTPPVMPPTGMPGSAGFGSPSSIGLFGGQLPGSTTPRATASLLGKRSLTLPKGSAFTCALKTRIVTASSGLVGCMVQRNVYGDDGRVLLIERGSHLDGEYRVTSVRPGMVRIPVLWTRVRTPHGVVVDIESPATGKLGESGVEGHVDNRWSERIGAAMLLSLIDDSVKLVIQQQSNERQGDTIVLPSTAANSSKLAEKVLDSTINIPPLIYQSQGGIVGIYVARDIDFSGVYALVPTTGRPPKP